MITSARDWFPLGCAIELASGFGDEGDISPLIRGRVLCHEGNRPRPVARDERNSDVWIARPSAWRDRLTANAIVTLLASADDAWTTKGCRGQRRRRGG